MNTKHPHISVDICISERHWELGEGNVQKAMLQALEKTERSQWRVVCANIIAECSEPYRTLVLSREILEDLRMQQLQYKNGRANTGTTSTDTLFRFTAEMHTPLVQEDTHPAAGFECKSCSSPV